MEVSMTSFFKHTFGVYADRRILIMGLIGFSCGIPLFLTASTLALWLKQAGLSNTKIGVLSLCALPYSVKFLWSPFIDRLKLPFLTRKLGQRRSWLLLSQILLVVNIFIISLIDATQHLPLTMLFATIIAFCAATQ